MTNANALPIQERLRDPSQELRWQDRIATADRIDALEKALRRAVSQMEMLVLEMDGDKPLERTIEVARAALGEGE